MSVRLCVCARREESLRPGAGRWCSRGRAVERSAEDRSTAGRAEVQMGVRVGRRAVVVLGLSAEHQAGRSARQGGGWDGEEGDAGEPGRR